ncbi:MAG TPA: hypothetical protein ENN81_09070 [Phycisphaerales bacterium]|nr:hypothetical protein [Phycisphaerales bacterium]
MAKIIATVCLASIMLFVASCSRTEPPQTPSTPPSPTSDEHSADTSVAPSEAVGETPGSAPAQPKTRIKIQGTAVSLIPPQGFAPTTLFLGVHQPETNSSIQITELPASLSATIAGFTDPNKLAASQMTLLSQKTVKVSGMDATLLEISQNAFNLVFKKWMLLLGDARQSVNIMATYPLRFEASLGEPLRQSLMTVDWDRTPAKQLAAQLPFAVTVDAPFELAAKMGDNLVYTVAGAWPPADANAPIIFVSTAVPRGPITDMKTFSETRLLIAGNISEVQVLQSQFTEIDSLVGYTVVGAAREKETGAPLFVLQVMLFEQNQYYTIKGQVGMDNRATYEDLFKRAAASFRRRK